MNVEEERAKISAPPISPSHTANLFFSFSHTRKMKFQQFQLDSDDVERNFSCRYLVLFAIFYCLPFTPVGFHLFSFE